jgi:hypothetical protein
LGRFRSRRPEIPETVPGIARAVRGLLAHLDELDPATLTNGILGRGEQAIRSVEARLAAVLRKDGRPLAIARPLERRGLGCCRDFAVLLCAFLRARGIPARVRVGFADYLGAPGFADHAVCEYRDAEEGRWVLVDAQRIDPAQGPARDGVDPLDVPRTRFLVAGEAWRLCRTGAVPPYVFFVNRRLRGWGVVRPYVVLDFACLNGVEPLLWDRWGLARHRERLPGTAAEMALLDRAAELGASPEGRDAEILGFYRTTAGLRAPARVRSPPPVRAAA